MLICNYHIRSKFYADSLMTNSTACYYQSSPWLRRDIRLAGFFSADRNSAANPDIG